MELSILTGVGSLAPKGHRFMLSPNPAVSPIRGGFIRSQMVVWVISAMLLFLGFGAGMWVIGSENANPPAVVHRL